MNVPAIFIAMDGTLLKASNIISVEIKKPFICFINQGVKFFLATDRHYEVTAPYHKELGLETSVICLNGSTFHDGETGKITQMKTVGLNEELLHHHTAENPCNVIIHTANGIYCKETNEEIDYWRKVGQIPPKYIGDLRQAYYQEVLKYSVRIAATSSELSALFKNEAEVIIWDDGFEMVAPNVSKWSAIKNLLHTLRISPSEVVAIGDGPNDIEMIRMVWL